jgi:hypothetical protein
MWGATSHYEDMNQKLNYKFNMSVMSLYSCVCINYRFVCDLGSTFGALYSAHIYHASHIYTHIDILYIQYILHIYRANRTNPKINIDYLIEKDVQ